MFVISHKVKVADLDQGFQNFDSTREQRFVNCLENVHQLKQKPMITI